MQYFEYPAREEWSALVKRPQKSTEELADVVGEVLSRIRREGDAAVLDYEEKFDHVRLDSLRVSEEEIDEAERLINPTLRQALEDAHANIARFHESQRFVGKKVETRPGVTCWQQAIPIERVGLYAPGGTAPLFSTVLMLATPARIAGCQKIVLCSPPNREGKLHPAILVAARIAGVHEIYKAGGVQAIGAMAYGTESIPKVSKIFGPGNQYVMAAKQAVSLQEVAIDMPAGPSEVAVVVDAGSNAEFAAADLLSQAEHGLDSQVLLISTDRAKLQQVEAAVLRQLQQLPRKAMAESSLANSKYVLVHDLDEAMQLVNEYAPEHLILANADYQAAAAKVVNAGSVFLGPYACESAGDYASGTNHTLPTSGYARSYSGVSTDSFIRKVTFQELTPEGVRQIGPTVEIMAANEQLEAHKKAMTLRLQEVEGKA
jgi:histidinol dehydrogenase